MVNRRDFLNSAGLGVVSSTLFGCMSASGFFQLKEKPNILWILPEDISPDPSCYGTATVQIPRNIKRC
jgi:hypothetical protein